MDVLPAPTRLVFSLTTTAKRIRFIRPTIDALIEGQDRPLDAVLLAVPPEVALLPRWLLRHNTTSRRPGILRVLRMARDYGPASKLLAALREGGERSATTVVVFGDDDVHYGSRIAALHFDAQSSAAARAQPTAFGSRRIGIGDGARREELLEATGSVSVRASFLPEAAFDVHRLPEACRLSDDYFLSHHLSRAGVHLALLPSCVYDFGSGAWPPSCGEMRASPRIEAIEPLSSRALGENGRVRAGGGDWRDQLRRYEVCQQMLLDRAARRGGSRRQQTRSWFLARWARGHEQQQADREVR